MDAKVKVRRRSRFSISFSSAFPFPGIGEKNSAQKSLNDLPEEIVLFLASFLNVGDLVNKYFTLNEQEWSL